MTIDIDDLDNLTHEQYQLMLKHLLSPEEHGELTERLIKVRDYVVKLLGRELTDKETFLVGVTVACVYRVVMDEVRP